MLNVDRIRRRRTDRPGPVLILVLRDAAARIRGGAILNQLRREVDRATGRTLGDIVVEPDTAGEGSVGVGSDVDDQVQCAGHGHIHPHLGRIRPAQPVRGRAVCERGLHRGDQIEIELRAVDRELGDEAVVIEGRGKIDRCRRAASSDGEHHRRRAVGGQLRRAERQHGHLGRAIAVGCLHVHLDGNLLSIDLRNQLGRRQYRAWREYLGQYDVLRRGG